jgi:hypothetical protein
VGACFVSAACCFCWPAGLASGAPVNTASLGFSLPLATVFHPSVFLDPGSDSTGTVMFLQGESMGLVTLTVWVQARDLPLEDYYDQVTRQHENREVLEVQEPEPFDSVNAPAGLHGRFRYSLLLPDSSSATFWQDTWVVARGERFFSFFWTLPDTAAARMDGELAPVMQALRFAD